MGSACRHFLPAKEFKTNRSVFGRCDVYRRRHSTWYAICTSTAPCLPLHLSCPYGYLLCSDQSAVITSAAEMSSDIVRFLQKREVNWCEGGYGMFLCTTVIHPSGNLFFISWNSKIFIPKLSCDCFFHFVFFFWCLQTFCIQSFEKHCVNRRGFGTFWELKEPIEVSTDIGRISRKSIYFFSAPRFLMFSFWHSIKCNATGYFSLIFLSNCLFFL